LSWQIIPSRLGELLKDARVAKAMMEMTKLDIERLEQAAR
jgi:predicted 3-demethylubiquinone-9 3-methyltransferase (glyoxalase superfamily)